jgi:hypothetical protein
MQPAPANPLRALKAVNSLHPAKMVRAPHNRKTHQRASPNLTRRGNRRPASLVKIRPQPNLNKRSPNNLNKHSNHSLDRHSDLNLNKRSPNNLGKHSPNNLGKHSRLKQAVRRLNKPRRDNPRLVLREESPTRPLSPPNNPNQRNHPNPDLHSLDRPSRDRNPARLRLLEITRGRMPRAKAVVRVVCRPALRPTRSVRPEKHRSVGVKTGREDPSPCPAPGSRASPRKMCNARPKSTSSPNLCPPRCARWCGAISSCPSAKKPTPSGVGSGWMSL